MYKNKRRIFERFEVEFPAKVKQPAAEAYSEAQCCDISASGAGLFIGEKLIFDTSLELLLCFPDGNPPLRTLSRVIWSKQVQENKWRSGLEFARIDLMGLRRIFAKDDRKC